MPRQSIGVISDTHGLLRPEVLEVFRGVGQILHAGDIGAPEVLEGLSAIAPVCAVRGNNDEGEWANRIPEVQLVRSGAVRIYMLHNVKELKASILKGNIDVVVSGHSHRPLIERREQTLFLNPGSAGPRRFKLPISLAKLSVEGTDVRAELIEL
jgi:putative phosphoesterase